MHGFIAILALLTACFASEAAQADVYKYVDATGKVYFTDAPLKGKKYRLEWKRESKKLVRENQTRSASVGAKRRAASKSPSRVAGSLAKRRALYDNLIGANARRYGLPPALIHAVIRAESAYDPTAVSRAGAEGLMQLMPGTAARYGVADSFNPVENVRGGSAYLRDLLDLFDWDLELALAGYNAGEGAVIKHGRKIPPYAETQDYVRKVREFLLAEKGTRPGVAMSAR
ncbi:MAG: lytic transglycosylase domain-containing protein [Thiocapsa sp.]|nr:lytic transglycosylase domain-containing protein [Thiocapsa sp.]MCG6895691.1 lytic transglycosylase domain-containing protein [Thiocapsa sp.]MCG6984000.1 lytic transglycosylase domain-containing protein [Thiocapsa sp.]